MSDWQRLGPLAEKVRDDADEARGKVLYGPWPTEDEREREFKTECALFAEAIYRCASRSEKRIGIKAARGILATILDEIDRQIERNGGDAA